MKKFKLMILSLVILSLVLAGCSKPAQTETPTKETIKAQPRVSTSNNNQPSSANMVTINSFKFFPSEVKVKSGETVIWKNEDSAAHTVEFDKGTFTSDELAKGDMVSFKFDKTGTFTYHCGIHQSMQGTVLVE